MSEQDFQDQHDAEVEADLHAEDVDAEAVVDTPPEGVSDPDDVGHEDDEELEVEELEDRPFPHDEEE